MDCHFIRDKIQDGLIATKYVPSIEQLEKEAFFILKHKLEVVNIHSPT